jgi:hypothetical protein
MAKRGKAADQPAVDREVSDELQTERKPLGDTGDGNTGVEPDSQGISNRPGDKEDRNAT